MFRVVHFFLILFLLAACDPPKPSDSLEGSYNPIFMDREKLEQSVSLAEKRALTNPAKIYFKDNYILITERYKGIHIIDNANPSNPINVGFIKVPGCIDVAAKGNFIYADNATDLVTIDMTNLSDVKVTSRIKKVFKEPESPDGDYYYRNSSSPQDLVLIEWVKKQ